jgi:carbonic anhydrase
LVPPGNIVPIFDDLASVGVSASIEYAVVVLGVQDVIVCGHSACGARLIHPQQLSLIPATARWLKYAQPAVEALDKRFDKLGATERSNQLNRLNAIEQMSHLHSHPAVERRIKSGKMGIHGCTTRSYGKN